MNFLHYCIFDGMICTIQQLKETQSSLMNTQLTFAKQIQQQRYMELEPPPLSQEQIDRQRYAITDMLDNIREARSYDELIATGARLFWSKVADCCLMAMCRMRLRVGVNSSLIVYI